MTTKGSFVWRYATGIGEDNDKEELESGWIIEKS